MWCRREDGRITFASFYVVGTSEESAVRGGGKKSRTCKILASTLRAVVRARMDASQAAKGQDVRR